MRQVVGREESSDCPDHVETVQWIGKPWRRLELWTFRHYFRGELVETDRTLWFHVGLRRLGVAATLNVTRQTVLDYSEERP